MPDSGAARLEEAKRLAKEVYGVARRRGSHAVPARLQRAAAQTTGTARVVVVGERKRGKSTLINALLGTPDLLPREVDVATNTYIEVASPRWNGRAAEPAAVVHLQSGASYDADIAEIGRWASEQGNPANARQVAYVQVLLPHPLLDAGLVIVDTPGIGGLASAHGTMTLTALEQSDALVLVLNAAAPASADELDFLLKARARVPRVLLIESAGPEAVDPRTIVASDREALGARDPALATLPITVVAPMDAHDALTESDGLVSAELRKLSNIDRFASDLHSHVLDRVLGGQAETLIDETVACLDELAGPDRGLVAALGAGDVASAGARVRAELAEAERRSPVTVFDARFVELRREVDAQMMAGTTRARDELLDEIEDRWSGAMAKTLNERCRSILADAAVAGGDRLVARGGALAAEAASAAGLAGGSADVLSGSPGELSLGLSEAWQVRRKIDHERVLGWLARGGPMLMIGVVTANPVLVGIGVVVVAANEQIQGASANRRRAREYAQRVITRGQTVLRSSLEERARAVRDAFVTDLNARHQARLERLRATISAVEQASDVEGARARIAEVERFEAALLALRG